MPSGNTKKRDYLFDNYKALLIALVVIGHFIELSYKDNEFLYALKWLVVSFHMPAFIFISGYFQNGRFRLASCSRSLPYLILYMKSFIILFTPSSSISQPGCTCYTPNSPCGISRRCFSGGCWLRISERFRIIWPFPFSQDFWPDALICRTIS